MIHDVLFTSRDFGITVHLVERDFPVIRNKKISLMLRRYAVTYLSCSRSSACKASVPQQKFSAMK